MAGNDLSDECVASVLKNDAHDSSIKYSALGLQAFLPKRGDTAIRKPNTRFLSHLLRATDAHNATVLAKEKRDARERQKALNERGEYVRSSKEDKFGKRRDSPERPSKRRREDDGHRERDQERKRRRSRSPERSHRHRHHHHRHRDKSPHSDHKRRGVSQEAEEDGRRSSHRRRRHDGERDSSSEDRRDRRRHRHTSPKDDRNMKRRMDGQSSRGTVSPRRRSSSSDSDPLEAIVGPVPPPKVKPRGRGAFTADSSAATNARFAADYDPSADAALPEPGLDDDWDMALEALRDRQKWAQAGAERLKAAGFTDVQVEKWAKGGSRGEKDDSDVRWAKKGEGREWDRGKVVGSDDEIELRPEWGRLKGT